MGRVLCLIFQVTASEVLPESMFIPVPGPDREAQSSTPQATANSSSEDIKKQAGQYSTMYGGLTVRTAEW